MRKVKALGVGIFLVAFLSACGGSEDTAPDADIPNPPSPPIVGCGPDYAPIPEGQTYSVTAIRDQLAGNETYRRSQFYAAGTGIPAEMGQLYLTPMSAQSPITQMRSQLTEWSDCSNMLITTPINSNMDSDETIESFIRNTSNPDPAILKHYVLEAFTYKASAPSLVEFVIDPSRYAGQAAFDAQALKICIIHYGFDIHYSSCPDVSLRSDGQQLVASAKVPRESTFSHVVLASTQPRGFDTIVRWSAPKIINQK